MTAILQRGTEHEGRVTPDGAPPNAPAVDWTRLDVIATIVFIQAAITVTSVIEGGVGSIASGGATLVGVLLTAITATMLYALARGLRQGRRRLTTRLVESALLTWAAVDLVLAMVLAGRLLEPVPTLTRIVAPLTVIWMLRPGAFESLIGSGTDA